MASPYMPQDIFEAIKKGHLRSNEMVTIVVGILTFKIAVEHLMLSRRIRDDLFQRVHDRIGAEHPYNSREIKLQYGRNGDLFRHVVSYLNDPFVWKCPGVDLKSSLEREAEYFKLPDMAEALSKLDGKLISRGNPYVRIERALGQIEVPSAFGAEIAGVAQLLNQSAELKQAGPRSVILLSLYEKEIMDRVVEYMLSRGYEIHTINDLPNHSVYHFCASH